MGGFRAGGYHRRRRSIVSEPAVDELNSSSKPDPPRHYRPVLYASVFVFFLSLLVMKGTEYAEGVVAVTMVLVLLIQLRAGRVLNPLWEESFAFRERPAQAAIVLLAQTAIAAGAFYLWLGVGPWF